MAWRNLATVLAVVAVMVAGSGRADAAEGIADALQRLPRAALVGVVVVQAAVIVALVVVAAFRHNAARDLAREVSQRRRADQRLNIARAELQRFAEITAHHLQEPTRRLLVFAQRLRKLLVGPLDDNAAFALKTIEDQAAYLHALVRDVQVYLAADTPLGPVEPTDPARVARDLITGMSSRIDALGANVTIGPTRPVPLDRPRLRYLLSALLDNALRYGGQAGEPPRIQIDGAFGNGVVTLTVTDHGPGIPAEYRPRVLEVFEHLHATSDSGLPGTGLGLAVARRIVESADGTLRIDDAPGGGTRIVISLPQGNVPIEGEPT